MLVFIKPESLSQIAWAALMAMAGLLMNGLFCPYADPLDDVVAISANCVLVINLIAGMLIKTDVVGDDRYNLPPEGDDGYDRATFDGVLVFINVLVVMVAVAILFWQVAKGEKERQKEEGGDVDSEVRRQREVEMTVARLARQASASGGSFSYVNPLEGEETVELGTIDLGGEEVKI